VIRITKEIPGVADAILPQIMEGGRPHSTLILSPPGGGKTTVLRDLIRQCAQGGRRIAVADERGELSAMREGSPQMDLGPYTDIITGSRKAQAVMMLLRAMNPQIIAMDEITAPEDTEALESAANCGVILFATAHGQGIADLQKRPMYRRLFQKGLFTRLVVITQKAGARIYTVTELEENHVSSNGSHTHYRRHGHYGTLQCVADGDAGPDPLGTPDQPLHHAERDL